MWCSYKTLAIMLKTLRRPQLTCCRPWELEWFAASAWNCAVAAAKTHDCRSAAVLFAATAAFKAAHPSQDQSCLNSQKVARTSGNNLAKQHPMLGNVK